LRQEGESQCKENLAYKILSCREPQEVMDMLAEEEEEESETESSHCLSNLHHIGLRYAGLKTVKLQPCQGDLTLSQPPAKTSEDLPRPHTPCPVVPTRQLRGGRGEHTLRSHALDKEPKGASETADKNQTSARQEAE
jgi:hypothetical protein